MVEKRQPWIPAFAGMTAATQSNAAQRSNKDD
jgi:hypothetical protein